MNQAISEIAKKNNGFVSIVDAEKAGVSPMALSRAVKSGGLERLERGLYCTPDTWGDEYLLAEYRFGRGILSHATALDLLDLSDRTPERITMTFPRGYNTSSASDAGIIPKTIAKELHGLGVTNITTPYGNSVRCYNAERSLCDMLRGTSTPDVQILNPAMKAYFSSKDRDIGKLFGYAKKLGVQDKVRNYVEVLL